MESLWAVPRKEGADEDQHDLERAGQRSALSADGQKQEQYR